MNKSRMKLWKKMIAAILAVTLLATSVDLQLLAAPVEEAVTGEAVATEEPVAEETEDIYEVAGDEETEADAKILSEVEAEREESSKTFLMSDGTFMVAQYGMPVHYEDENEEWQEIDNTLIEEADTEAAVMVTDTEVESSTTDSESEDGYTTTEKSGERARIKFSKKLKEGKTVSIKDTEFPISWGIKGAEKQTVQIIDAENEESREWNDKFLFVDTGSQLLRYEDIFEGVDAEYMIQPGGVKENIVLKEKGTENSFEIVYDIGELTPVQTDEQTIQLKDGEELIYQIRAPYMQDAKGEMSDAISLSMEQTKDHEIIVTMTADEEWLAAEERAYPVVLDPTVMTETSREAIDSTFVSSGHPSMNYSSQMEMIIGRESSDYEYCRGLIKIELPKLNPGDMVVSAQLNLLMYSVWPYAEGIPDVQLNAHRIIKDWKYNEVTWNSKPDFDSTVLDYAYMGEDDFENNKYQKNFDITEAVKGWYEGTFSIYGIEIKMAKESGSYAENCIKGYFWPERYNSNEGRYPRYTITYRNNKGLEDYWTYTALSAGTAGTAYVNDYTGNLVFIHDDVSTTGELLPVTLQHVYNSYMQNQRFTGSHPSAGRGWKLSIQQTVLSSEAYGLTGDMLELYPYAYEDGDGTVHYFYKKEDDNSGKYYDEDGLGLELTINGSNKIITDEKDNKMTFGPKGNLTSIADANGNTITVSYKTAEDGKSQITKVTDGAGHIIRLEEHNTTFYNLKTITDPSGRATTYSYVIYDQESGNRAVSTITYPDGTSSRYTYDSTGALLTARSSDGSGLRFTYTNAAKGKRVKKVEELATDGTVGQTISFDRSQYNTTVAQTSGSDDAYGNADDLLTTYKFDNFGRTVATNTKTKDGSVYYGGDVYTYTAGAVNSSGSNVKKLNRVASSAYSNKAVRNYLKNHSAEADSSWGATYWLNSESEYTAQMTTSQKLYGKRSFAITGTKVENNGGGAYNQAVSTDLVQPGKTYTFSGYVKTSNVVRAAGNTALDKAYGACLAVRFVTADGIQRNYSEYLTDTTATGYNNGWRRLSLTFTVPDDATEVRVYTVLRNATGTAYFDGLQVETGSSANSYNMLDNASFELTSSGKPTGWELENEGTGDGNSSSHYFNGSTALKLEGEASTNKFAYQEVEVSGKESDIYIVSGWAWAEALPNAADITRCFDIFARVYYADGATVFKNNQALFNRDVTGWQRASMAFDLSDGDAGTNKTPTRIRIGVRYYKQENAAYFDSMQLVKDVANSYTYDDDGNLITSKENGENSSAFSYNNSSDLTSLTDAENSTYEYTYNDAHQVTKATAPMGQDVDYTYKSKGPLNYSIISSQDEAWKIRSGYVYNAESNGISAQTYVTEEWDQNGYKTKYGIDLQSGRTNWVETPDGVRTNYTYNGTNDLLTKVTTGQMSVSYSYDAAMTRLKNIEHNGFQYHFAYDKYGNVVSTSVEDQELSVNTYAQNNGKLVKTEYGNGDKVEYSYNKAGNVSGIKENNVSTASWTYDYSQQPLSYNDKMSGQKHTYSYDITGRLLETKVSDTSIMDTAVDSQLFSAIYNYDKLDRLERTRIYAGGRSPYAIYAYNANGQSDSTSFSTGREISYTYDKLGRLLGKSVSTETPLRYNYRYHLSERNGDGEDTYKTTLLKNELFGNKGYQYDYDKMGNIIAIREGTRIAGSTNQLENFVDKVSYVYDDYNQLIRENNLYLGQTIVYTYDNGGNLEKKSIYEHTTEDEISTPLVKEILYTYETEWKDRLASYDGDAIQYDEIGNPTEYRGNDLDWTGRRLESLTTEDETVIDYTYNSDGIRTKKTVGSVTSEYYYSGGQLAYEKRGDVKLYYLYDAEGQLAVIQHVKNGTVTSYYPMVNSRGDIEALYNGQGVLQAQYRYDSWGKMISVTDGNGNDITDSSHIGNVNPFRYRGYYYDTETGFYYVSSRYYDPEVGRFISADGKISGVGGEVRGYNLYSYCFNNPVNMTDPDGNWPQFIKKAVKWVAQKVIKPITKTVQKALSKINGTYSTGINVSGTPMIFCYNAQGGISVDTKGNVAVQGSVSVGVTGGSPSASITVYQSRTNASNINKLEGLGYQIGGSAGIPVGVVPLAGGADFNIIPDSVTGKNYYGTTTSLGVGVSGAELHVEWGNTDTWNKTQFNVFDLIDQWCINIMEW